MSGPIGANGWSAGPGELSRDREEVWAVATEASWHCDCGRWVNDGEECPDCGECECQDCNHPICRCDEADHYYQIAAGK